jgi:predicted  nucleic acid-binding Zn-ribbon protein
MRFLLGATMAINSQPKEVSMQNDLEKLLQLQIIDYDLGELERSKEYLPDMMENLTREIEDAKSKLESASQQFNEAKVRQKNLELDLAAKEEELQRFQKQMMTIKTNKEYDALVAEIDAVKTVISQKETEFLETMDLISQLEKEVPDLKEKLAQIEGNNTKQLKILQEKIDSIGDKIAHKGAERKAVISSIPRPVIAVYERVRRGKGGTVVVTVRKRSCSACHNALTPQRVQEIRREDRIHTCDNCGRLLYWDNEQSD